MASKFHIIFVYGTLKQGEPNHTWFTKSENSKYKFIDRAETMEKYPLIIGTKYNIPFLLHQPGMGTHVQGELYEVNNQVLENLDNLEGHPHFYVREMRQVKTLSKTVYSNAWMYFIKNFKPELLEQPFYESYSNNGEHGLKYVAKYERNPADDSNTKHDIFL